jgi:hypothetical protein
MLLLLLVRFGTGRARTAGTISDFLLVPHTRKHTAERRGESLKKSEGSVF